MNYPECLISQNYNRSTCRGGGSLASEVILEHPTLCSHHSARATGFSATIISCFSRGLLLSSLMPKQSHRWCRRERLSKFGNQAWDSHQAVASGTSIAPAGIPQDFVPYPRPGLARLSLSLLGEAYLICHRPPQFLELWGSESPRGAPDCRRRRSHASSCRSHSGRRSRRLFASTSSSFTSLLQRLTKHGQEWRGRRS